MRDTQKSRVYEWEWDVTALRPARLTEEEACQIIADVCAAYGRTAPPARFVHGRRSGIYLWRGEIRCPARPDAALVVHETVHHLVRTTPGYSPDEVPSHGPEFAGLLLDVLAALGWPRAELRRLAREHRVRIGRPPIARVPGARLARARRIITAAVERERQRRYQEERRLCTSSAGRGRMYM